MQFRRDLRRPPPRRRRGRRLPRRGKEALAGLARADTRPQRQAKPLNAEPLGTPQAADRRGRVDVAISAVLRDGPLRRSEAADLRWEDVTFQASGARGSSPRGPPLEDLLALRPAYLDPQAPVFGISDGQVGRTGRTDRSAPRRSTPGRSCRTPAGGNPLRCPSGTPGAKRPEGQPRRGGQVLRGRRVRHFRYAATGETLASPTAGGPQ